MSVKKYELSILNPRGEIASVSRYSPCPRLDNLNGKKIGILKFTVAGLAEQIMPYLEEELKKRSAEFRFWMNTEISRSKEASYRELVEYSDGVIVMLGFTGTSSARLALEAAAIERLGKPVALMITRPFQANARFVARSEGLSDISLAVVPLDFLPRPEEVAGLKLGEIAATEIVRALTEWKPESQETPEEPQQSLHFSGRDHSEALENMEKHFLTHGWSDGLPLVPPTEEAVIKMLQGTDLPREQVVASIGPAGGAASIEKIAINAVLAGCLPQYLPVVIAAVEAITDPSFNLREVQCTSCNMAPLLIVSGPKLIQELNINYSFSTLGPGWRANACIGRAIRLIMINLGHTWPGVNDMKTLGSPFKSVPLIAENESIFAGYWDSLRVAEGFDESQPTISVMPAMSWQPDIVMPEPPSVERIVEYIAKQGKVKHDRLLGNWGLENMVVLCGATFDCIRKEGISRADFQKAIYKAVQVPCSEFLNGRDIQDLYASIRLPQWVKDKCKADPNSLVPLLAKPDSVKICVTGGAGPWGISYISTFGYWPAHFVTKPIKLPSNWSRLLKKYKGWESPLIA